MSRELNCGSTSSIFQCILKSDNSLHKPGFVKTQSLRTVVSFSTLTFLSQVVLNLFSTKTALQSVICKAWSFSSWQTVTHLLKLLPFRLPFSDFVSGGVNRISFIHGIVQSLRFARKFGNPMYVWWIYVSTLAIQTAFNFCFHTIAKKKKNLDRKIFQIFFSTPKIFLFHLM